ASWEYYDAKLSARMTDLLTGFGRTIAAFVSSGKPVTVILQTPGGDEFDPRWMLGERWRLIVTQAGPLHSRSVDRRKTIDGHLARRVAQIARQNGAAVIDPGDYLCSSDVCATVIDGEPLHLDAGHVRAKTARDRATFMDHFVLD